MKKIISIFILGIGSFISDVLGVKIEGEPYMFTITGYYSPLPNQPFYITGSYESEIRLNGSGVRGADGTPVYAGMIAAPPNYAFGTKICLPNLGCGAVNDRGGAIVKKGKRALARHDRLDVWMGYGEEGLLRALAYGVQHVEGQVFPKESSVQIAMNFEVPPSLHEIIDLPNRPIFDQNLVMGGSGDKVASLQKALNALSLYEGLQDGIFNDTLKNAVFEFQKRHFIVENENSLGAGIFGPQTRSKLTSVLYKKQVQDQIKMAWDEFHFNDEIQQGKRNGDVFRLQQVLVQEEFMDVHPTGYFGPVTKGALIDFQLAHNIIKTSNSPGAGRVGPSTQKKLNELLEEKKAIAAQEKQKIIAYQKKRQNFNQLAGKNNTPKNIFAQKN